MRDIKKIAFGSLAASLFLLFSIGIGLSAESMGVSHGYDLDGLWARAQKEFDLKAHDAALLLESRQVSILDNGNLKTRVHRVVWIGTEVGIEDHADLRIPWNSATSTFTVVALRTWNDGRWWPDESEVSEVAVVETLPFALAQADDYTSMRETMLLHDGVELPCIMETIYEIEEQGAASDGADDLFVFPQNDPAVLVEYVLTVPSATTPKYRSGNGAPEPEIMSDADQAKTYIWKMSNMDRLGTPRIAHPAAYAPNITWSTWKDWETLGRKVIASFDGAAVLNNVLTDSLAERLKHEPNNYAKERAVANLVNEWTRSIDYDWEFWRFSPRAATSTFETGYGHALDRAVLAAALFREAAFTTSLSGSIREVEVRPCLVFRSAQYVEVYEDIPGLSRFEGIAVGYEYGPNRLYDPAIETLQNEDLWIFGRTYWSPAKMKRPMNAEYTEQGLGHIGVFELALDVEPASEGEWSGKGIYHACNHFSPFTELSGLERKVLPWLDEVVQSVLPGSQVKGYNPESFAPLDMTLGFDFESDAIETNSLGRISFTTGDPANGIMSRLPRDVHLFDEDRDSPILLDGRMEQRIKLRLKVGDREIVHLPEGYTLENDVGSFVLTMEKENGWITIDRKLHLERSLVQPEDWPQLRALLLEEQDPAHRKVILK